MGFRTPHGAQWNAGGFRSMAKLCFAISAGVFPQAPSFRYAPNGVQNSDRNQLPAACNLFLSLGYMLTKT